MSVKTYTALVSALFFAGFITQWLILDSKAGNIEVEVVQTTSTVLELADDIKETHKLQKEALYEIRRAKLHLHHALNELKRLNRRQKTSP